MPPLVSVQEDVSPTLSPCLTPAKEDYTPSLPLSSHRSSSPSVPSPDSDTTTPTNTTSDPRHPLYLGTWLRSIPGIRDDIAMDNLDEPHLKRKKAILQDHPEIVKLYGTDIRTLIVAIISAAAQVNIAYYFGRVNTQWTWPVFLGTAYLVGGTFTALYGVLIHEATHGLVGRSKLLNRITGLIANIGLPVPIAMSFRRYHLEHHTFQGVVGLDPDLPLDWEKKLIRGNFVLKTLWILIYPLMYVVRGMAQNKQPSTWELYNLAFTICMDTLIVQHCGWTGFWYLFLSLYFGYSLHPGAAHFIQEHYTFDDGQETYSYYGILNTIFMNIGYHNEHHDFTKIPWSNLPAARKLASEYYDTLAYHTSWLMVHYRFITERDVGPQTPTLAVLPTRLYTSTTKPARYAAVESAPVVTRTSVSAAAQHAEGPLRNDWTREEIQAIYNSPLMDLMFYAAKVHRANFNPLEVQQSTLLSIKTGGCSEDCKYCPQSSRYKTNVKAQKMLEEDVVLEAARKAKEAGSTRFCMGAAWRDLAGRKSNFNKILHYVKEIRAMDMEVCCTLGMLNEAQANQLKEAGLTAYNHNLDTSREYYPKIISTRSYDERLQTIAHAQEAGISVCSGGIIGLGEQDEDRVGLLHTLSTLKQHPESVPINALLAVEGTPLEKQEPVSILEMVRMISTARIIMPRSMVRLSAGRVRFSVSEQAMCFFAGANSIFTGDKLLTTPNNVMSDDTKMFELLNLVPKPPNFAQGSDKKEQPTYVSQSEAVASA
ncbi:hypothetical protein BZG36_01622 [Bifiguratus adelaidae]|uniref:biotin synthase n=1 Tax=Bifiguratus adelaidae TaxID=1938954 RepID=A0A261Y4F2_9FUNG|nr:hypothetical protein BZG36_01622 [Bifiguratus adelaidae]